jgi:predicted transcriptional regulator
VLELLKRRPCTVSDIAEGLDLNINEAAKFVGILKGEGLICAIRREGRAYFFANDGN